MTHSTKWYATKDGITIGSGGTLTIASGGTLAATGYSTSSTPSSITTTAGMTIGSTLAVTTTSQFNGTVTVGNSKAIIAADTGNTTLAGTLGVTGAFSVNTTYFTASTAGNIVAKGTSNLVKAVTVGALTTTKSIVLDPSGTGGSPGTSGMVQIVFDGTDLIATNNAGKYANMTTGLWST